MVDHEKLTPEEADIRNQAMLRDLEHMYAPVDEAQSLERIRNRLLTAEHISSFNSVQSTEQFMQKTKRERFQPMNSMQVPIAHKKARYLNILAAGIIAALIVGSLLFEVTHVYYSNTGSGRPNTPQVPISKATATVENVFPGGPGWKHVATFKGIGSTTITKLHLKFTYAVGSLFVCTGKGDVQVVYNSPLTMGFGATCYAMAKGEFIERDGAYTLERISIVVDPGSSWQLQLGICVDKRFCGSHSKTVTPTPVPALTPRPTLAPKSTPTPGPTPVH